MNFVKSMEDRSSIVNIEERSIAILAQAILARRVFMFKEYLWRVYLARLRSSVARALCSDAGWRVPACVCACACVHAARAVRACVRAVRACVRACVRAVRACVWCDVVRRRPLHVVKLFMSAPCFCTILVMMSLNLSACVEGAGRGRGNVCTRRISQRRGEMIQKQG